MALIGNFSRQVLNPSFSSPLFANALFPFKESESSSSIGVVERDPLSRRSQFLEKSGAYKSAGFPPEAPPSLDIPDSLPLVYFDSSLFRWRDVAMSESLCPLSPNTPFLLEFFLAALDLQIPSLYFRTPHNDGHRSTSEASNVGIPFHLGVPLSAPKSTLVDFFSTSRLCGRSAVAAGCRLRFSFSSPHSVFLSFLDSAHHPFHSSWFVDLFAMKAERFSLLIWQRSFCSPCWTKPHWYQRFLLPSGGFQRPPIPIFLKEPPTPSLASSGRFSSDVRLRFCSTLFLLIFRRSGTLLPFCSRLSVTIRFSSLIPSRPHFLSTLPSAEWADQLCNFSFPSPFALSEVPTSPEMRDPADSYGSMVTRPLFACLLH